MSKYRAEPKTNDSLPYGAPRPFVIKHITYHHIDVEDRFSSDVSLVEDGILGDLYLLVEILKDGKEFGFTIRPHFFEEILDKVHELTNKL